MRHLFGIIDIRRYFIRILPCKMTEHILILFFASTECHDLHSILTELVHHICYQVKAFLVSQSGNDTNHHRLMVLLQIQFFLKRCLVLDFLSPEIRYIIVLHNAWICFRIIILIIDSVHNTGQTVRSCIHQTVQAFSIEWHLNLFCISIAYSCDPICIDNSTFQIIGILICFQLIRCEIILRQSRDVTNPLRIPCALKLQIVNGHDRLDSSIPLITIAEIIKVYRNESCLPVMTVDDIWSEINKRQCT